MKQFLSLVLMSAAVSAFAQETPTTKIPEKHRFGVTANVHQSNIRGIHDYSKGRIAPAFGAVANISLQNQSRFSLPTSSDKWYFQPVLEVSLEGEKADDPKGEVKYYNNMINLPLYMKYYFNISKEKAHYDWFVMAGPMLGFSIGDKIDGTVPTVADATAEMKKFNAGASVAAGYVASQDLELFLRYDHGFTKAYGNYDLYNTYNYKLALGINYFLK